MSEIRRRAFITLLGSAAAWPLSSRAQQAAMPVIGYMSAWSADDAQRLALAFRRGLSESGFVEGENVTIEYRWADYQYERLSALAADLVRRKVAVIAAAGGTPSVLAAKAATTTIPIVFAMGSDPVTSGVVTSLGRPSGNVTGASFFTTALGPKRLELLREMAPTATTIAALVNPDNPVSVAEAANVQAAARDVGQQIHILNSSTKDHIDEDSGRWWNTGSVRCLSPPIRSSSASVIYLPHW
jgi:putative ABC transport system substrate-binding protein